MTKKGNILQHQAVYQYVSDWIMKQTKGLNTKYDLPGVENANEFTEVFDNTDEDDYSEAETVSI